MGAAATGAAMSSWGRAMEFEIGLAGQAPDMRKVEDAIRAADPAAVVGLDLDGKTLRVAAVVSVPELATLLTQAGCPVASYRIVQLPSVCCGGCSG